MENIPKIARERLSTGSPVTHPEANVLAAFSERALKGRERAGVVEHLASCAECRELVWLAQAPAPDVPVNIRKVSWYSLPALRWATAAAVVLVVGGAVLLKHQPSATPARTVAQVTAPEQLEKEPAKTPGATAPVQRELESKKDVPEAHKKVMALSKVAGASPRPAETTRPRSAPLDATGANISSLTSDQLEARASNVPAPAPNKEVAGDKQGPEKSAAENVEIAAAAPAISAETEAVTKAKQPAATARAAPPSPPVTLRTNAVYDGTRADGRAYTTLQKAAFPRWGLAADGALQRSLDGGRDWERVIVAPGAVFRAISSSGTELWAGGAAGLLYHSSDAGQHWTRVKAVSGDETLNADITAIEFSDLQHGKLTTTDRQLWITSDAGQSWQKQ